MERVAKMQKEVAKILECSCKNNEKRDAGKRPNVLARNASWPDNPRSAARRAAQDLVVQKAVDSPPLSFEHYVVDFSEGILTKVRKRL